MLRYIIEFALIHSILLLVYKMVMGKETQLTFLRGYLQASLLLAIIVPFIHIPAFGSVPAVDISGTVTTLLLPEVIVTPSGLVSQGPDYLQWFTWVFAAGAILTSIRLLIGLLKIRLIIRGSEPVELGGKRVHHKDKFKSSFTYFNRIIIDKDHFKNPLEIVRHEEAHVRYGHSYDLLVANLLTIPFWWLPSIWITIKEFKKIHEYQADAYALMVSTPENYINALVNNVLVNHGLELTSSFHDTKIFNRLNFIKKMKKNISPLKIYSTMLFIAMTVFVFSCEDKIDNEIDAVMDENQTEEYSEAVQNRLLELRSEFPDTEFKVIQISGDKEMLSQYDFSGAKFKEAERAGENTIKLSVIVTRDFEMAKRKVDSSSKQVVEEVDEWPEYAGGKGELVKYIGENVRYPKDAATQGISGKVFVEFVVDKNGAVTDAKVIRGIGAGCDEEALRVVKAMPDWTPGTKDGEIVNVKMVLPITFQLSE